jgi:hypothetical protein
LGLMAQATLGSNDIKDPHEFAIWLQRSRGEHLN